MMKVQLLKRKILLQYYCKRNDQIILYLKLIINTFTDNINYCLSQTCTYLESHTKWLRTLATSADHFTEGLMINCIIRADYILYTYRLKFTSLNYLVSYVHNQLISICMIYNCLLFIGLWCNHMHYTWGLFNLAINTHFVRQLCTYFMITHMLGFLSQTHYDQSKSYLAMYLYQVYVLIITLITISSFRVTTAMYPHKQLCNGTSSVPQTYGVLN